MFPKVSRALSSFLEPLKPVQRPGQSVSLTRETRNEDGGHGSLGYEKFDTKQENTEKKKDETPETVADLAPSLRPEGEENPELLAAFRPGLTQVILDISSARKKIVSGGAIDSYESGAKEQKSGTKLPKGSMLDKKVR